MSNFLSNIISRHAGSEQVIKPRTRGVFESRSMISALEGFTALAPEDEKQGISDNIQNESAVNSMPRNQASLNEINEFKQPSIVEKYFVQTPKNTNPGLQKTTTNDHTKLSLNSKSDSMELAQQKIVERIRHESIIDKNKQQPEARGSSLLRRANIEAPHDIRPRVNPRLKSDVTQKSMTQQEEHLSIIQNIKTVLQSPPYKPLNPHSSMQDKLGETNDKSSLSQSTIKVHIGRIEIRAVKEVPIKQTKSQTPERRVSLDEFLKKRDNKLQ
jgi:hypothetical protein